MQEIIGGSMQPSSNYYNLHLKIPRYCCRNYLFNFLVRLGSKDMTEIYDDDDDILFTLSNNI